MHITVYVKSTPSSKTQLKPWSAELSLLNPFNPEFTIVILIHYKPRIAVAILDL